MTLSTAANAVCEKSFFRLRLAIQAVLRGSDDLSKVGSDADESMVINAASALWRAVALIRRNIDAGAWGSALVTTIRLSANSLLLDPASMLCTIADAYQTLSVAASLGSDIYQMGPAAVLAGDKLYETGAKIFHTEKLVDSLRTEVDFPSIRKLVNDGKLTLRDVLSIREKSTRFRQWLQTTNGSDLNALVSYHNEVGRETGLLSQFGRGSLKFFGSVGGAGYGAALGAYLGFAQQSPDGIAIGTAIGSTVGAAVGFLGELATGYKNEWRPIIFGDWLKSHTPDILKNKEP